MISVVWQVSVASVVSRVTVGNARNLQFRIPKCSVVPVLRTAERQTSVSRCPEFSAYPKHFGDRVRVLACRLIRLVLRQSEQLRIIGRSVAFKETGGYGSVGL